LVEGFGGGGDDDDDVVRWCLECECGQEEEGAEEGGRAMPSWSMGGISSSGVEMGHGYFVSGWRWNCVICEIFLGIIVTLHRDGMTMCDRNAATLVCFSMLS
jgi:hypothetical protein